MTGLRERLEALQREGLYRTRHAVDGAHAPVQEVDGRTCLSFCSNDYLGLAAHPEVVAAFQHAAASYGVGAGAAQLVCGHHVAHQRLEEALAEWLGRPRALLFSTGYMANAGVVASLVGRRDTVVEDRLNHASLIDAARLSGARLRRYPHAEPEGLSRQLGAATGTALVATDGVFSMDGDSAPLPTLAEQARAAGAWFMVDDAHGLGVLGPDGRGSLAVHGLGLDEVPILVGTLGKALGTFGAFVAGSEELVETLIQNARSYIYTTAPPPAVAEATRTALDLALREPWRRERLQALVDRFRAGARQQDMPLTESRAPIQPLVIGSSERAMAVSRALWRQGLLVTAIRPPTVPQGTARLRVTFSAQHTPEQVDRLVEALGEAWQAAGD